MLRIREYKAGDFSLMPPRETELGIEREEAMIDPLRVASPAFTLFSVTEGVIGAAGVIIFRKGVGEAWLRGSTRFTGHERAVARYVRVFLNEIIRDHNLHRVQMICKRTNRGAMKFAKWLGFQSEGRLRQAGEDRSDFIMMSRIQEEARTR